MSPLELTGSIAHRTINFLDLLTNQAAPNNFTQASIIIDTADTTNIEGALHFVAYGGELHFQLLATQRVKRLHCLSIWRVIKVESGEKDREKVYR